MRGRSSGRWNSALATRYGHVAHSRWYEGVTGKPIAAAAAALPPDVAAVAQERGRARDLEATVVELSDEFRSSEYHDG